MSSPALAQLECERPTCDATTAPEVALAAGWTVLEGLRGVVRAWCPAHGLRPR